jgi:DNA-binding transcriptional regulator YdaS (Cro superfamily)
MMRDKGLNIAIEAAGSVRALGRLLGISHEAVRQWPKVPDKYLLKIEKVTGVDRKQLRPDLYRR